nr:cobalamin biosynthesis protein [uncultured Sellimonas sp.]
MREHDNEKKLKIVSFTKKGHELNRFVMGELQKQGIVCMGYRKGEAPGGQELLEISDMKEWISAGWGKENFLFIGAAGIAVRSIAPFIRDKFTDSAVLVMDDQGNFVIPLLSGHVGGAVAFAKRIGEVTKAMPVLTTATDLAGKFAVDVFARENEMEISDRKLAKEISAHLLNGEKVGFYCEFPIEGEVPPELVVCGKIEELGAYTFGVAVLKHLPLQENPSVLHLFPRILSVGIGCRKGVGKEHLKQGLLDLLEEHGYRPCQIAEFASIHRKAEEEGILALAREYHVPFRTFSAEELNMVEAVSTSSEFVNRTVGTDNVCERAAILSGMPGSVVQTKRKLKDMTFSFVERRYVITVSCGKESGI